MVDIILLLLSKLTIWKIQIYHSCTEELL